MRLRRDPRALSTSLVRNPMTSKLCACYPLNVYLSSFSSLSTAVASTGTDENDDSEEVMVTQVLLFVLSKGGGRIAMK